MSNDVSFSRVHVEISLNGSVGYIADFATSIYEAQKSFFSEMSDIQGRLAAGEVVTFEDGLTGDPNTTGGLMLINIKLEEMANVRKALEGLGQLGLSVEKNVWKNI